MRIATIMKGPVRLDTFPKFKFKYYTTSSKLGYSRQSTRFEASQHQHSEQGERIESPTDRI